MYKSAQLALFEKAKVLPQAAIRVEAYPGESFALRFLSIALVLCVAGYLYFVGVSIMNVIANREASAASERLQSSVGSLEQNYFELSKAITPDMASQVGLVKTTDASYVRRATGMATNVQASAN